MLQQQQQSFGRHSSVDGSSSTTSLGLQVEEDVEEEEESIFTQLQSAFENPSQLFNSFDTSSQQHAQVKKETSTTPID